MLHTSSLGRLCLKVHSPSGGPASRPECRQACILAGRHWWSQCGLAHCKAVLPTDSELQSCSVPHQSHLTSNTCCCTCVLQLQEISQYAVSSLQAFASRAGAFGVTDAAKQLLTALPTRPQALLAVLPSLANSIPVSLLIDVWLRSVVAHNPNLVPDTEKSTVASGMRTPDLHFGHQAPTVESLVLTQHGSYVQQLLVAELGVLEAVWVVEQQRQVLLGLPLPAMQLLLSCSTLKVRRYLLGFAVLPPLPAQSLLSWRLSI